MTPNRIRASVMALYLFIGMIHSSYHYNRFVCACEIPTRISCDQDRGEAAFFRTIIWPITLGWDVAAKITKPEGVAA